MSLNSASVIIKMISGLISVKVIAVLLGPSAIALLGNFKNFITSTRLFAILGIQEGIVKYTASEEAKGKKVILSSAFFSMLITSSFIGVVVIIFSNNIGQYLFKTIDYRICVVFFGLLLPLYSIHIFFVAILKGLKKFKSLVVISIISSVFGLIFTMYLIYFHKIQGALIALAIVESLIIVFYLYFFINKGLVFKDLKLSLCSFDAMKKLSSYSLMSLTTALVHPFSMLYLRNLIIENSGIEAAGLWEAINRISGYYLMILTSGISMYYLPKLSAINNDYKFLNEIKSYFKTFMPLCVLLFLCVFLFKDLCIRIVFSDEFLPMKKLLVYQLIGDLFKIASYAFAQQFLAKRLAKQYIVTEILFFIVYLILSFIFIPVYGIKGVLWAYVVSYIFYFLMMIFIFRNLLINLIKKT